MGNTSNFIPLFCCVHELTFSRTYRQTEKQISSYRTGSKFWIQIYDFCIRQYSKFHFSSSLRFGIIVFKRTQTDTRTYTDIIPKILFGGGTQGDLKRKDSNNQWIIRIIFHFLLIITCEICMP